MIQIFISLLPLEAPASPGRKEREKETGRSKRFKLNELSVATVSQQPGCILFKSGQLSEGYLWVF